MVLELVGLSPAHAHDDRSRYVVSYPERCAEHGGPRSASASASSVSAFFSAFFRSCAAARSTGTGRHCIEFTVFLIQL